MPWSRLSAGLVANYEIESVLSETVTHLLFAKSPGSKLKQQLDAGLNISSTRKGGAVVTLEICYRICYSLLMKSQLEKITKIKPDLCERCEGDEGWLDTPHAFCDACMGEVLACAQFANDPHGLDMVHYQNAYNHYA